MTRTAAFAFGTVAAALLLVPDHALAQRPNFAWATSLDRLGDSLDAVRARLGPPARSDDYGVEHTFLIGGCEVTYAERNGRIDRFRAAVTAQCHPAPQGRAITPDTTFGQLYRQGYSYRGHCLDDCPGEHPSLRAEPRLGVGLRRPPPTLIRRLEDAEGWSVVYEGDDAAVQAAWRSAIDSGASPPGDQERYFPQANPAPEIMRLLQGVHVRRVSAYRLTITPSLLSVSGD